uniref:Uncharacterized protein n=1 Tax=Panagrolaimus sp. JU765 TaxID=591449 RepID=A0AC34QZN9_9BILA
MFKFSVLCYNSATSSTIKHLARFKPSILKKDPADQFGLIGFGKAPQIERLKKPTWKEEFTGSAKVVFTTEKKKIQKKLPEITIPATLSAKKKKKLENESKPNEKKPDKVPESPNTDKDGNKGKAKKTKSEPKPKDATKP